MLWDETGPLEISLLEARKESEEKGDDDEGMILNKDALDAQLLSVTRDPSGKRMKNFVDGVKELTCTEWAGWPLTGPRTTLW